MSPIAPFYDWSIKDIYDFWLTHVRPPMDAASAGWTSFTFLVLDVNSTKDRKCVVCSNAPDIGEKGDEEVLKSVRMSFAEALPTMVSFEMMTMAPSESNKETALNVVPPVWLDTTDTLPGEGLKGKLATPEYARAAKRRAFLQALAQGVV
jgi:hypothetical protein